MGSLFRLFIIITKGFLLNKNINKNLLPHRLKWDKFTSSFHYIMQTRFSD